MAASSRAGFSISALLVGVAIAAVIGFAATKGFLQNTKSLKKSQEALNFESSIDLVRQGLANRKACNLEFWNVDAGREAIALDHDNTGTGIGTVVPNNPTAYTDINAIAIKSSDPNAPTILFRVGQDLGNNVRVTKIALSPVNNAAKIIHRVAEDRYNELVKLDIDATSGDGKIKSFSLLTPILYSKSVGSIEACFQNNPTITTVSARRAAYLVNGDVDAPCNNTTPTMSFVKRGASLYPRYKEWCENYGYDAGRMTSKVGGVDPDCQNAYTLALTTGPTFPRTFGYIKGFEASYPKRTSPPPALPPAPPAAIYLNEGRCQVSTNVAVGSEDEFFVLDAALDNDPNVLALGCNTVNGWTVSGCALSTDGAGGALSATIENIAGKSMCVFRQLKLNAGAWIVAYASVDIVCARVEQ